MIKIIVVMLFLFTPLCAMKQEAKDPNDMTVKELMIEAKKILSEETRREISLLRKMVDFLLEREESEKNKGANEDPGD